MTNIIQFLEPEVVDVNYILDQDDTIRGLGSLGSPIELYVNPGEIIIAGPGGWNAFDDREAAAKFFWACAYFLDGEKRYAEDKYVGLNYEKGDE